MQVRVNTDNNITNSENFSTELEESIQQKLGKFSTHITTIEIFLSDENSNRGGAADKICNTAGHIRDDSITVFYNASENCCGYYTGGMSSSFTCV